MANAVGTQNLTHGLYTDLLNHFVVYQIFSHALQGPLGEGKPHFAGIAVGQLDDLISLSVAENRRTSWGLATAQAINSFGIKAVNPLAHIDRMQIDLPADILHPLSLSREQNNHQPLRWHLAIAFLQHRFQFIPFTLFQITNI